jgi:RimJ/RimL family protein N-acetyltransferase
LLAFAQDALQLRRIEAKAYAYNVLSVNALRRNGFKQEGVLRKARVYDGEAWDIFVFSILEPEMAVERVRDTFPDFSLFREEVPA